MVDHLIKSFDDVFVQTFCFDTNYYLNSGFFYIYIFVCQWRQNSRMGAFGGSQRCNMNIRYEYNKLIFFYNPIDKINDCIFMTIKTRRVEQD